jgi:hypothetical protein
MTSEDTENKKQSENSGRNNESIGFPKEYVEELREREVSVKKKLSEAESALSKKDEEYKKLIEEKVKEISSSYKKDLMLSKIQIEALREGIVDIDGVKLADLSKLDFDENHNIIGAKEFIEELKKNKTYLFKKSDKTTFEKEPPSKQNNTKVDVRGMSKEDYQKYKISLLKQK